MNNPVILPVLDFSAAMPIIILAIGIVFTLLLPLVIKGKLLLSIPALSMLTLIFASVSSVHLWNGNKTAFQGMYTADNFTLFASQIIIIAAILTVFGITARYCVFAKSPDGEGLHHSPEVFPLILTAIAGAITLVASRHLIVTFIALETLSIPLYVLAGLNLSSEYSKEASIKYFLTGAFASGFLAYGISLIYGATGTLSYSGILLNCNPNAANYTLFAGLAIAIVGFAFKVALVPFHAWVPDVYQGSPSLISGFMASVVKAAGFSAVLRFFGEAVTPLYEIWWIAVAALAVLSMTVGNIIALRQTNLKRLFAYSSIAHAGYLLLAVLVIGKEWTTTSIASGESSGIAIHASLFYLLAYALAIVGVFTVIWWLTPKGSEGALLEVDDVSGLSQRHPLSAALFALFIFSLAGFPFTAGFLGKFFLFLSAIQTGFTTLVIFALLNTVVSAYYYLKIVVAMYMKPLPKNGTSDVIPVINPWIYFTLWIVAITTLWLGIFPSAVLRLLSQI
jgi:NADH-quinone oxidoreductase subunit N